MICNNKLKPPGQLEKPQLLRILTSVSFILGKKNIEVDLNTQFNIGRGKSILHRKESNITMVKPEKHELETRLVQKLNQSMSKVLSIVKGIR